ncbi:MAG: electron transfer flavoprotein subunit alpha/FixB family protein [Chloroflexota bacterium]
MDLYNLEALMGDTTSTEDYRDLWIVDVDGARGASLLNEARRMADSLGAYVHYIGAMDSDEAIAFGADRVHPLSVDSGDAAVSALASFFESRKPEFVFFTAGYYANEIANRLAGKMNGGAITDCIALRLRLDESTREIIALHPVYDGAYYLDSAITSKPQIFTVRDGVYPEAMKDKGRSGEVGAIHESPLHDTPSTSDRVRALGKVEYESAATPLRKGAKVIAVGRKGNDEASVGVAREMAQKIGAAFAGDRSAFDAGWIDHDHIVGIIGTEIAPDVYIAAGIWGDTLHRAGVEGAKYVIAIHPDKRAPIFQYADACIVGEPKEVLPKLMKLL